MATLKDRNDTALIVIDVQRDVVGQAHDVDRVVTNIGQLVDRARAEKVPVVWVQHEDDSMPAGSEGWEIVDELTRDHDEPSITKRYGDAFEDTDLESILSERGIGHLVVTGAQTDACIRATLHGAVTRGYDATLVGDAHTTEDMRAWGSPLSPEQAIAYANMYWSFTAAPGRTCATVDTAEVVFGTA